MTNCIEPTIFSLKFSLSEVFNFKRAACIRYYDPGVGRFLQKDPDPGRLGSSVSVINKYIYVGNSPASFVDPSGKIPLLLVAVLIGAALGFSANLTAGLGQGASGWNAFKYGLIGAVQGALSPLLAAGLGLIGLPSVAAGLIGAFAAGAIGGYAAAKTFGGDPGVGAALGGIVGGLGVLFGAGVGSAAFGYGFTEGVQNAVNYGVGAITGMLNTGYGPPEEASEQSYRPGYYIRVEGSR